jgi:excisionase family DNA binding protein
VTLDDLEGRTFATVQEVAGIMRRDQRTITQAIRDDEIPATREGQQWRIPVAWLKAQAAAGASAADHGAAEHVEPGELADLVADRVVARLARMFATLGADKEAAGPAA